MCGGKPQGTFASKIDQCEKCNFYKAVQEDEGYNFMPLKEVLKTLFSSKRDRT
jgi:hypothetical protein